LIQILPFAAAHLPAIESLLDARFGPARRNRTAYRLRDGVDVLPALSFVAIDGDALVGSVQCWPLSITGADGARLPLVLLGPVAVAADREGQGVGHALMQAALAAADAAGAPPILLIGDAPYYGRFGFAADATAGWQVPGPVDRARLLLRGSAHGLPAIGWLGPGQNARAAA
jgi:predicted N-acetyltransferase YhbS